MKSEELTVKKQKYDTMLVSPARVTSRILKRIAGAAEYRSMKVWLISYCQAPDILKATFDVVRSRGEYKAQANYGNTQFNWCVEWSFDTEKERSKKNSWTDVRGFLSKFSKSSAYLQNIFYLTILQLFES